MTKDKHLLLVSSLLIISGLSINTYATNRGIADAPAGDGHVMIGDCDSGVPDSGGIQAGVDACVANAWNHGKLVSCVTHYTKGLERQGTISKNDRKAIKGCAAHSDIGKGNHSKGGTEV